MSNHAHRRPHDTQPPMPARRRGWLGRLFASRGSNDGRGTVAVGSASSRIEAELMAGYLRSQGVKAVISADDEGGLNPAMGAGLGVRILVPHDQHDGARQLLKDRPSTEG